MDGNTHQAREFVEMAASLVDYGLVAANRMDRLSESSAEAYWTASKCRIERWAETFQQFRKSRQTRGATLSWMAFRPWFDEVLISEVLTRVWAAFAVIAESQTTEKRIEPIARSVYVGHLEARQRMLRFLIDEQDLDKQQMNALDRIRRNAERWTDMLLGYMMVDHEVNDFAFDIDRVRDFAEGVRHERKDGNDAYTWSLLKTSLRSAFGPEKTSVVPNFDLNQEILYGVFSSFGPEFYDAIRSFSSLWRCRLDHIANDAELMIHQLMCEHDGLVRRV